MARESLCRKKDLFLGDRTISFTGAKYSFHYLNVWRIYKGKRNMNILFIWTVTPQWIAHTGERKSARRSKDVDPSSFSPSENSAEAKLTKAGEVRRQSRKVNC